MASQHPFQTSVDKGRLLSPLDRKTCQKLCSTGDELTQKRAKALLALDDGCTQAKAGELSEMTRGQVNYLVTLFRKKGMNLFVIDTITVDSEPDDAPPESVESKPEKKKKKSKEKSSKKKKKKKKDSPKKQAKEDSKKTKKKGKKKKSKKKK